MKKPARPSRRRPASLHFTKMHGLGNDFVVIDLLTQQATISANLVRRLADRRFGVGCDQVLVVEPPQTPEADFRYRIFNADGGEVEQCGNGARCFARFVRARKFTTKELIRVETLAGPIDLLCLPRGLVQVDMGAPVLAPERVPFVHPAQTPDSVYTLDVAGTRCELGVVSMGNPHAVLLVDDIDLAPVALLGPQIQQHAAFPQQVNVGFMQVLASNRVRLRVYERGAGETLACGTGACAAVVSGILRGLLDPGVSVRVKLPGGDLEIRWEGAQGHVMMTGPATFVFDGQIRL